jgi:hypothetical protein
MFTFSKPAPAAAVTTTRRPAGKSGTSAQVRRPDLTDTTESPTPVRADEHHDLADRGAHAGGTPPWDSRSGGTGMDSGLGWLSFQRIVDIPFEACVAALESWQREGYDDALQIGHSRLRGPVEHDRDSGTRRVDVRLARGPLRPLLRMRLDVDCWSPSSSTALELIPCRLVRATASYFQAGHLLLDSLSHSLQLQREIQALDLPAGDKAETDTVRSGSRSADSRDIPQPNTLLRQAEFTGVLDPPRSEGNRRGILRAGMCDDPPWPPATVEPAATPPDNSVHRRTARGLTPACHRRDCRAAARDQQLADEAQANEMNQMQALKSTRQ